VYGELLTVYASIFLIDVSVTFGNDMLFDTIVLSQHNNIDFWCHIVNVNNLSCETKCGKFFMLDEEVAWLKERYWCETLETLFD
jgi:hypothetical protein